MQPEQSTEHTMELLNAHGPYDHGLWDPLASGRTAHHKLSKFLVETISAEIKSKYSKSQLTDMSILDVGGYDGWILVQIQSEFNFKRAVCVEPRLKNIQKGEFARKYYGVQTSVNFLCGELDSLNQVLNNKFDFVLFLNVLHHVDSTPRAVKSITNFCRNTAFISSAIIERPKKSGNKLKKLMNLKDISYLNSPHDFATAGFKFESSYFDGSTTGSTIVNLPEKKLIEMSLVANGFEAKKSFSSLDSKNTSFFTKSHGELWAFVVATKSTSSTGPEEKCLGDKIEYESQFLFTHLNVEIIDSWLLYLSSIGHDLTGHENRKALTPITIGSRLIFAASRRPRNIFSKIVLSKSNLNSSEKAILQNISKAPLFKSGFELAKHHLKRGQLTEAKTLLKDLTSKPYCDWRIFYRSCYFLMVIAQIQNDPISFNQWKHLLDIANPHFPITAIKGVVWVSKEN